MSDEFKPLPYNDWLAKNGLSATEDFAGYSKYLVNWYKSQGTSKTNLRADYIQLLRDLNFVFGNEKRDRFLSNINLSNREELINSIPYFVTKIKELVKSFSEKRDSVKKSKLKYNLVSSNKGIETLLYEYILRSFTSKNKIAPVPYKQLSGLLPELKNSNNSFFIEVEELYDNSNYFDTSPTTPQKGVNLNALANSFPYRGNLNTNQLLGILTASLKQRAASTPLSRLFFDVLDINNPSLNDGTDIDEELYFNAINTIAANEKFMGNDLYGLSAIKTINLDNVDFTAKIELQQGNNWFYWPSGAKIYTADPIDNIYFPIDVNKSELVKNGATGSGDYRTSDIILTDKKGFIEGAWLLGPRMEYSRNRISITIDSNEKRQFLWPYVGFSLTKNTNVWRGFSLNDNSNKFFYFLSDREKNIILNNYYTLPLPALSSQPVYLNATNFYKSGALPAPTALDADVIIKQKHDFSKTSNYTKETEVAYLYRFHETEIPIKSGVTNILWPVMKIDSDDQNIPFTVTSDTCDPVELKMVDVQKGFRGAVAGTNSDEADIIYKLDRRSGKPIEAAWLANSDISSLDSKNQIDVYNTKANSACCEILLLGSNQDGLFGLIESGQTVSFIWGDKDTYADEVFNYVSHSENCPYEKLKTNYYANQDHLNPKPLSQKPEPWTDCTCRATLYSPIGHKGNSFEAYDGMTDLLFADPQGFGPDFELSTWKDSRCLDYKSSPQFSYFKLDNNAPDVVGFWNGKWQTPTGARMVLKTGRRYSYYRTNFKRLNNDGPKLVLDYSYKDPVGFCLNSKPIDMILCVDLSNSQKYSLETTRQIVEKVLEAQPDNVHIGIVAFDSRQFRCSYLTRFPDLDGFLDRLFAFDEADGAIYRTNIVDALRLAEYLLTTTITENNKVSVLNWNKICKDVNATIVDAQRTPIYNQPRLNEVDKKIVLISDGAETSEIALGYGKTQAEADQFSNGNLALMPYVNTLKRKTYPLLNSKTNKTVGFTFQTIDIGPMSMTNNTMEKIASTPELYFNLEKYLITNDTTDVSKIIKNIVYNTINCYDVYSRWKKLVRDNADGSWIESNEDTDMILRPGDNLVYLHRSETVYRSPLSEYAGFSLPSKSFCIKIPLRGWDYLNNKYVNDPVVTYRGAKPFWGKAYVDIDKENNFEKSLIYMGGHTRWIEDYLPIRQPEVSMMVLEHGDFIEYNRRAPERLKLNDVFDFVEYKTNYQWNKLEFSKQYSNLEKFFKNDRLEYVATPTNKKSDMVIEGFYEFKPARYNYYARQQFTFEQDLELIYKCRPTYSSILTAKVLEAKYPYAHLDNVNFPTTPLIPYTYNFVTRKNVGGYLLPHNLGVPHFSPYGYTFEIDEGQIARFERQKREMLFLDPEKYGPVNRNLSNIDNLSPTRISSIDNRWMMLPYGSGEISGVITNTKNFQKFTAYQSEYEVLGTNNYGVSRPNDNFQFYNQNRQWIFGGLTERGEVTEEMYLDRRKKFLANLGVITKWRMDLYGNNYALYKSKLDTNLIQTDNSDVNYNDIDAPQENLSTDDYPRTQQFPENYENIAYNSKAIDYLDFIVEED